jgi:hypothetical protein
MADVRPDLAARPLHPLLDLLREPIHARPWPRRNRQPSARLLTSTHPTRDCLVITARQLRRTTQRPRQIKRFQDLHHFLTGLQASLRKRTSNKMRPGVPASQDKIVGRTDGHERGEPAAASGDFRWPPTGRFPWPPSDADDRCPLGPVVGVARVAGPAAGMRERPGHGVLGDGVLVADDGLRRALTTAPNSSTRSSAVRPGPAVASATHARRLQGQSVAVH